MALGLTQLLTEMSTRNISCEYRRPVRRADNLTTFLCRLSWNLGASTSWNPQGLCRPVMGLFYLYLVRFNWNVYVCVCVYVFFSGELCRDVIMDWQGVSSVLTPLSLCLLIDVVRNMHRWMTSIKSLSFRVINFSASATWHPSPLICHVIIAVTYKQCINGALRH